VFQIPFVGAYMSKRSTVSWWM